MESEPGSASTVLSLPIARATPARTPQAPSRDENSGEKSLPEMIFQRTRVTQWSRRGGVRDFWVKFFLLLFWPYMVSFYV